MNTSSFGDLKGRRILITGANRGIGKALVEASVAAGATVYAHARNPATLQPLIDELGVTPVIAELSDPEAAPRIAEQVGDAPLDVLVNNAAYETYVQLAEAEMELVEDILRVNLVLPVMLAKALIPNLQKGEDPSVINVTSIHDSVAVANNGPYAMAKAGLLMYTRNAAIEFAKLGIRVNALAPGAIETDMNRETINKLGREKFNAWIPAGRVGTCDELVAPFIFLAGRGAGYTTGARLCVDGAYEHHTLRGSKG